MPTKIDRFVKQVGRGINRYKMIQEGDRVLLGISGGKDSLVMAYSLAVRLRWLPVHYHLEAVTVDWIEHPLAPEHIEQLENIFASIKVPFRRISTSIRPPSFRGKFNCYLCARNRKRVLFEIAGAENFTSIAFGHHLDDIAETTLMNIVMQGRFATMNPRQEFFKGRLHVIRPLCLVRESHIRSIADFLELPEIEIDCPLKDINIRADIKPIIESLAAINPHVRENILRSLTNIDCEYLPS